jgi:hypothetical protein
MAEQLGDGSTKLDSSTTKRRSMLGALLRVGKKEKKKMLSDFNLLSLQPGLDAYSKGFMVQGLSWNTEQVELSLVEVRRRLNDKRNTVWVSASVCYAQKPLLEV